MSNTNAKEKACFSETAQKRAKGDVARVDTIPSSSMPPPFVARLTRIAHVDVVGRAWGGGAASYTYQLSDAALQSIAVWDRVHVENWVNHNAGDFEEVTDFSATCGEAVIPWASGESELQFEASQA